MGGAVVQSQCIRLMVVDNLLSVFVVVVAATFVVALLAYASAGCKEFVVAAVVAEAVEAAIVVAALNVASEGLKAVAVGTGMD